MENDKVELIYNTLKENPSNRIVYSENNKSICLKGIGYSLTLFFYIKPPNRNYLYGKKPNTKTQILLYCKIPFKTLKKRIVNVLNKLEVNKDLIESFCSEIREQLEKVCYKSDLCKSKRKRNATKKVTHSKKYRGYYIPENEIRDSELRLCSYLYREIFGIKIVDIKPIELLLKIKRYLELGNEIRTHKYQWIWIFGNNEFNGIRDYIKKNGMLQNNNITISSFKPEQIQISIYSGLNWNLYNSELLDIGLKQLRESLGKTDISIIDKVLFEAKLRYEILNSDTSVEIGIPIRKPTTLKEIKKHWVIAKVYNLKDIVKFWIDTSRSKFDKLNPFEMDFKFKIRLSKLFRIIKFMDNLPYLIRIAKEIEVRKKLLDQYNKLKLEQKNNKVNLLQAFERKSSNDKVYNFKNAIANFEKDIYEINQTYNLIQLAHYKNYQLIANKS